MKIDTKISKALVLSFILAACASWQKAEASTVTITNHERSVLKINVVISSSKTPYCYKCLGSPLRGGETRTIGVPAEALKGAEYFSVVDVTNGFMGESECANLSVLNDYKVSFYETTLGTRCTCKKI
jgi:hypothetical protein